MTRPLLPVERELVERNLGLAFAFVRRHPAARRLGPDRALSACFAGLIAAARGYRFPCGRAFATYAERAMRSHVRDEGRDDSVIHVPRWLDHAGRRSAPRSSARRDRWVAGAIAAAESARAPWSLDRPPAEGDRERIALSSREPDPAAALLAAEDRAAVAAALGGLGDKPRRILEGYAEGLSARTLARELDCSPEWVRILAQRGIAAVRAQLGIAE